MMDLWQVLQFVHGIVAPLADVPVAELALQIYLQAAYSASEVAHLEMIAYEFLEQVLLLLSLFYLAAYDSPAYDLACLTSTFC